jgi:hypothetical protein
MNGTPDIDLHSLAADWQAGNAPATPARQVRAYVQRRSRLLAIWTAVDAAIGCGFLAFLAHRAITHPDPLEKLAMSLLALITAGTMVFSWWNWRGTIRASAENTATFVALSAERSRRFARAGRAAWVVLALQSAVFTPWVYYRLYGGGRDATPLQELFGWGVLATMCAVMAAMVVAFQSWTRRDAAEFQNIRSELES